MADNGQGQDTDDAAWRTRNGDWATYTGSPLRAFENETGVEALVGFWDLVGFTGDHPYLQCEVKRLDRHERTTEVATKPMTVGDTMNLVWSENLGASAPIIISSTWIIVQTKTYEVTPMQTYASPPSPTYVQQQPHTYMMQGQTAQGLKHMNPFTGDHPYVVA